MTLRARRRKWSTGAITSTEPGSSTEVTSRLARARSQSALPEPHPRDLARTHRTNSGRSREIQQLFAHQPGGGAIGLRGQDATQWLELLVRQSVVQEIVAGRDFRPLDSAFRDIRFIPIVAGTHFAEAIGLPGRAVVILKDLIGLADPVLIGAFDDLPEQGLTIRVARLDQVKAEENVCTGVGGVAIEDLSQ